MDDLKLIKKHYGEKMMHLCRELFPTILETEGLLYSLMIRKFHPTRHLYYDIVNNHYEDEFKSVIYSLIKKQSNSKQETNKTPKELLDEAGYTLYECKTEEDIQSFKKYYKKGEELCTFRGGRLERCFVFFAVKKDVDKIKRKEDPARQDEYGTSVISIQFTKGKINTLSIKNRYNHTVDNPDSTFSNNLDNIKEGLNGAFSKEYGYNFDLEGTNIEIPGYVIASYNRDTENGRDGKYYKYNFERNNVYYCPDNIIVDNFYAKHFDKSKYLIIDNFILDLTHKTLLPYSYYWGYPDIADSFTTGLTDINSIEIVNIKETKRKKIIINKDITIIINNKNEIVEYHNEHLTEIGDNFLVNNQALEVLDVPNVEKIGNDFLRSNKNIKELVLPKTKEIGAYCLEMNESLEKLDLPKVRKIKNFSLTFNKNLKEIDLPLVESLGEYFVSENETINNVKLPNIKEVGSAFLRSSQIKELILPNLETVENYFLQDNSTLEKLVAPKLKKVGSMFLFNNLSLEYINLPELRETGSNFIKENKIIKTIILPKLKVLNISFMKNNKLARNIDLSSLVEVKNDCFTNNEYILNIINTILDLKKGVEKSEKSTSHRNR